MEYAKDSKANRGDVLVLPDDSVVEQVQEIIGVHVDRMKKISLWPKFIEAATFRDPKLFKGESGEYKNAHTTIQVDFEQNKLVLGKKVFTIHNHFEHLGFKVIAISGILITSEMKDQFVAEFWSTLPRDVLIMLASQVEPKDVVRLCSSSKTLSTKCNDQFYDKMLQVHYDRKSENAKVDFIKLSGSSVWVCGNGSTGQLGLGNKESYAIPVKIEALLGISFMTANEFSSYFVDKSGDVWFCGTGGDDKDQNNVVWERSEIPARINSLRNIVSVGTGGTHTFFVDKNGDVWGYGNGISVRSKMFFAKRSIPVKVNGLRNITSVSVQMNHALFLDQSGDVWSYGSGYQGKLGHGNAKDRSRPTKIKTLSDISAVSAGDTHSLFLGKDGQVWSCGNGSRGQLGLGMITGTPIPTKLVLQNIIAISAGHKHSLFLDKGGHVWTCGYRTDSLAGDFIPVRIESVSNVIAISAGIDHSLLLDKNGHAWSYGRGDVDKLGHGDGKHSYVPRKIKSLNGVVAISAGGRDHSLFQVV